jgi:geranylgeranyl transferase type-1 subunit beta
MTYCALLALAVLRDDYALLDRAALKRMVGACQDADGGCVFFASSIFIIMATSILVDDGWSMAGLCARFVTMPGAGDADLRMTYCAFAVCALLGDWSCIDLPRALSYIQRCRVRVPYLSPTPFRLYQTRVYKNPQTYEGGYAQTPLGESLGGPTYCALAALHLVPADHACAPQAHLQRAEWHATVRWLVHMQAEALASVGGGGFAGRTNKLADACYGFWCGAALAVRPSLSCGLLCEILISGSHGAPTWHSGFLQIRSLVLENCSMRTRSARFLRSASTNLVGSAKHRANIPVSIPLISPPFRLTCLCPFP